MAKKKSFWKTLFGMDDHEKGSANTATERLKVIVASENRLNSRLTSERIERMKREILEVVNKYVNGVQIDDVNLNHRHEDDLDVLEMNINLPDKGLKKSINATTTTSKVNIESASKIEAISKPVANRVEVKKVETGVKPQVVVSNSDQLATETQAEKSQTTLNTSALDKVLTSKDKVEVE